MEDSSISVPTSPSPSTGDATPAARPAPPRPRPAPTPAPSGVEEIEESEEVEEAQAAAESADEEGPSDERSGWFGSFDREEFLRGSACTISSCLVHMTVLIVLALVLGKIAAPPQQPRVAVEVA